MLGHLGMISLRKPWFQASGEQWGRYNLPRYMSLYVEHIIKYICSVLLWNINTYISYININGISMKISCI